MSLTVKLLLSFALVVATAVGVAAYLASQATGSEFQTYVRAGGQMYEARVAQSLTDYYSRSGNRQGVAALLLGLRRTPDDRLVLADTSGRVVADTGGQWIGEQVSKLGLSDPTAISVGGRAALRPERGACGRQGAGPRAGGRRNGTRALVDGGERPEPPGRGVARGPVHRGGDAEPLALRAGRRGAWRSRSARSSHGRSSGRSAG